MARIHIQREGKFLGAAVSDYWIDWGDGAPRNARVRAFPPRVEGAEVLSEQLGQFFETAHRPSRPDETSRIDVLYASTPDGPWMVHQVGFATSLDDETIADWPADACLVGKLGSGGRLTWDRPPGTVDLDFVTIAPSGLFESEATLRPTSLGEIRVEAGKTYHIEYEVQMSGWEFSIREAH